MAKKPGPPKEPHPITAPKIRRLAGIATAAPSKLTTKETQELGASVLRHIEPRATLRLSSPSYRQGARSLRCHHSGVEPTQRPRAGSASGRPAAWRNCWRGSRMLKD